VQPRARSWVSSELLGATPVTQVPPMRTRPRQRRPGTGQGAPTPV